MSTTKKNKSTDTDGPRKLSKREEKELKEYIEFAHMRSELISTEVNNAISDLVNAGRIDGIYASSTLSLLYVKLYRAFPNRISISQEGIYLNADTDEPDYIPDMTLTINGEVISIAENIRESLYNEGDNKYKFKSIDVNKSFYAIVTSNPDAAVYRDESYPIIFKDDTIVYYDNSRRDIIVLTSSNALPDWVGEHIVERNNTDTKRYFDFATYGSAGYDTISLEIKKYDVDVDTNYNDDLPHEAIVNFLSSDESGLVILHGNPGTGKSAYIRHLMYTITDKEFLVLDNSVFNSITDASFIQLLMEYENAIIILEDCESMLVDRMLGNNRMAALLNLSDGLLGDSFKFKFICTFNANIGNIDKALLRKGRMRLKYEFTELNADKTQKLAKKIGKTIPAGQALPLAEIYNYGELTDHTAGKEAKLGFTSKKNKK